MEDVNLEKNNNLARLSLIISMTVFGTIGLFRRFIPLPSGMIAFFRGLIGTLFLLLVVIVSKRKSDGRAIKRNLPWLVLSGAFIGINWILLFEAYNYTSVATATLCYYMAPIFVIIASPFLLKEKLRLKQALCVAVALCGMVLVSGVLGGGEVDVAGILCGLGAAVFYASVILLNKKISGISAYDKTIVQLASATAVILPYTLIAERGASVSVTPTVIILLLVVGAIHTGASYTLYFGSLGSLSAQTAAIFSYVDPVVAILLSAVVLREKIGVAEIIGAVLILGAAAVSELPIGNRRLDI